MEKTNQAEITSGILTVVRGLSPNETISITALAGLLAPSLAGQSLPQDFTKNLRAVALGLAMEAKLAILKGGKLLSPDNIGKISIGDFRLARLCNE